MIPAVRLSHVTSDVIRTIVLRRHRLALLRNTWRVWYLNTLVPLDYIRVCITVTPPLPPSLPSPPSLPPLPPSFIYPSFPSLPPSLPLYWHNKFILLSRISKALVFFTSFTKLFLISSIFFVFMWSGWVLQGNCAISSYYSFAQLPPVITPNTTNPS